MTPPLIYCASGNRRAAEIATRYGFRYGARLPDTVYFAPYFADQEWKAPDRVGYMAALSEHRPALATVLDWEHEAQLPEVLEWATEAAAYVSEAVIIIPKVMGEIGQLPRTIGGKQVRIGYSVPTTYGGTSLPVWEFAGWPVHLLGGSPDAQLNLRQYMDVHSADGNYILGQAEKFGQFYSPVWMPGAAQRAFPKLSDVNCAVESDVWVHAITLSCINYYNTWQGRPCGIRYAHVDDLPQIVRIIRQNPKTLGGVFYPALRKGIANRECFVAIMNNAIVGFVNWHAVGRGLNKGFNVIYEIAVDKQWQKLGIGQALLHAVPKPHHLKCTVANAANGFYERAGFMLVQQEVGKRQPLNVWRSV